MAAVKPEKSKLLNNCAPPHTEIPLEAERLAALDKAFYQQSPLRVWRAPLSGRIRVNQKLRALQEPSEDGISANTYYYGPPPAPSPSPLRLSKTNKTDKTSSAAYTAVPQGESFYFLPNAHGDARGDDVEWDITLRYEDVVYLENMDKRLFFYPNEESNTGDADGDFDEIYLTDLYEKVPVGAGYKYRRKGDWKSIAKDNPRAYDLMQEMGWFVPGLVSPEGFRLLWRKAGDYNTVITATGYNASETIALFSYYDFDAGLNRYAVKEKFTNNAEKTAIEKIVLRLVGKCSPEERKTFYRYAMPDARIITPEYFSESTVAHTRTDQDKEITRRPGSPGYYYPEDRGLDLDYMYEKLLHLDTATGEVFLGEALYGRLEDDITNDIALKKDAVEIKIPLFDVLTDGTESLVYYQNYTLQGPIEHPDMSIAEHDAFLVYLREVYFEDRFMVESGRWDSINANTYNKIVNNVSPAEAAGFENAYTASGLWPFTTYTRKSGTDAAVNRILRTYTLAKTGLADPFQLTADDLYVYAGPSPHWGETDVPGGAQVLDILQLYYTQNNIYSWETITSSLTYLSNALYRVEDEKVTMLCLEENKFFDRYFSGNFDHNSGEEFSAENLVQSPVSYRAWRTVTETERQSGGENDGKIEEKNVTKVVEIPIGLSDFLYGGKNTWYYAIWLGDQDSIEGTYRFSREKLLASRTQNTKGPKSKDEIEDKKLEDLENERGDTDPVYYINVTTKNTPLTDDSESNGLEMFERETYSGHEIGEDTLIGTVAAAAKKINRPEGDSYVVDYEYYFYCPFIEGSHLHTDRAGGSAYYELPGAFPAANTGGSGGTGERPIEMVNIRRSTNSGEDTIRKAEAKLVLPFENDALADLFNATDLGINFSAGDGIQIDASFKGVGVTQGTNENDSSMHQSLQDINGDGIPDLLQSEANKITVTPGRKNSQNDFIFGTAYSMNNGGPLSSSNNDTTNVLGASFGSGGAVKPEIKANSKIKSVSVTGSGGGSMTITEGHSLQEAGLMDLNGDGLPDYVSGGSIHFNTGTEFSTGHSHNFTIEKLNESSVQSFGASVTLSVGGKADASSSTKSDHTGTDISIGGAVNMSLSVTGSQDMLMDLNGDGLPDKVRNTGNNMFAVSYNTGNTFKDAVTLRLRDWDLEGYDAQAVYKAWDNELDASYLTKAPVVGHIVNGMGIADGMAGADNPFVKKAPGKYLNALDLNTSLNVGVNGSLNGSYTFYLFFLAMNITVSGGGGVNANTSINGVTMRMTDMDGDGLPDRVLRIPGSDHLYVQRNLLGKIGLLKTIRLPQGGRYELGYTPVYGTVDMPQFKYVLGSVTTIDDSGAIKKQSAGSVNSYTITYEYRDGYYDRGLKEFMGFGTVIARYADGTEKETRYYNREYYHKGMTRREVQYDKTRSRPLREKRYEIHERYPLVIAEYTTQWELDSDDGQGIESRIRYTYDLDEQGPPYYGNVVRMDDFGGKDTRPITALLAYKNDFASYYLHAHPVSIEVWENYDNAGRALLRRRTAAYNGQGSLTRLDQYYDAYQYTTHVIEWTAQGNLAGITSRNGAKESRIAYTYETELYQYVTGISQWGTGLSRAYESSLTWEVKYGVKASETDENGNLMRYEYDEYGRLIEVWSPYDNYRGGAPAVRYAYSTPAGANWYAVTENKIHFDAARPETMATVIMLDGLGRALYTAKEGTVRGVSGVNEDGWNISGAVHYDHKGRTVAEGQTRFKAGALSGLLAYTPEALLNPTRKEYDDLDRVVRMTLPDGAVQETMYQIRDGYSAVRSRDPKGNTGVQKTDSRGNILYTARYGQSNDLLAEAGYVYNGLGEMLTAFDRLGNPLEVTYDLLGRRTSLQTQDMGLKRYGYDEAGNLIWEEDEVLRKQGVKIQYVYDGLNRLREITLPRRKDQRANVNTVYEYGEPGAAGNAANRITKISDESGTVEYGYGKLGQTEYEKRVIYSLNASRVEREVAGVMEYLSDYLGRMERITYPDGETVSYYYDHGGQIQRVSGTKPYYTEPYEYVKDIGYDEYGQRVYIEYGNGVSTSYQYDPQRRWLKTIETNRDGQVYQNIAYDFDLVGNVEQYENAAGRYSTSQSYSYDDLYQLTGVEGNSTQYRYSGGTIIDHQSRYEQSFSFDEIGNMTHKTSNASITNNVKLGSDLNYEFAYEYYEKNGKRGHQAERIGDMYYRYDGNGNVVEERFGGHGSGGNVKVPYTEENGIYSTPYAFILTSPNPEDRGGKTGSGGDTYQRDYVWDYQNRLIKTQDPLHTVQYRYGADGQRAVKYSEGTPNETLYFNNMWQMGTSAADSRWLQSKHIFVGETRIATKNGYGERNSGYETEHQYWYHGDHLGSAQVVTDYQGELYERIEYTPYGETWIEHKYPAYTNTEIPYRFTSKELDPETGLYYYGARYLDPRTSRWISGDPAVGEYIPEAPVDDEAKKRNGNLPGGGGIFNLVNLHVYHYAGNNPIKYTDPDGRDSQAALAVVGFALTDLGIPEPSDAVIVPKAIIYAVVALFALAFVNSAIETLENTREGQERISVFRAVSQAEATSIDSEGIFTNPFGIENKYFSLTEAGALIEGGILSNMDKRLTGENATYFLFESTFPKDAITPDMMVSVDGGIDTIVIPTEKLILLTPPINRGVIPGTED